MLAMRGSLSGAVYRTVAMLTVAVLLALTVFLLARPGPVSGSLTVVPRAAGTHQVGDFVVALEDGPEGPFLGVAPASAQGWDLWSSIPGDSFVSAARG